MAVQWFNFGGNVSWGKSGVKRVTYYARTDADGRIHKPAGPASRDAIMMAISYQKPSTGYGSYIGGNFAGVQGNGFY